LLENEETNCYADVSIFYGIIFSMKLNLWLQIKILITWQMSVLHLQMVTPHVPDAGVVEDWK